VRGSLYNQYKEIANIQDESPTIVTPDNIQDVKVLLIGNFVTLTKATGKCICWTFKVLYPHFLPLYLDRDSAKKLFDKVKV
jgi:hypothetical protein